MTDVNTPHRLARLLVHMDYDREQIMATMRDRFPAADVATIVANAYAHREACAAELDHMRTEDAQAAIAAEMDLTKSIHRR